MTNQLFPLRPLQQAAMDQLKSSLRAGKSVELKYYVYVIFLPTGEPCYVGKGSGARWKNSSRVHNRRLSVAFKIYGDLPVVKVRNGLSEADAFEVESALISAVGRGKNGPLFNMTNGGDGASGAVRTAEHRAAIGAATRGCKRSPETRARISAAQTISECVL